MADEKTTIIQPQRPDSPITATIWVRDVDVYQVFDHEFQSIKFGASQSGLYLTFFGIAFGTMASLLSVLLTVELKSPRAFAAFVVGFAVSVVATALLGLKARNEYLETGKRMDYIEQRSRKRGTTTLPVLSSTPYTQDSTSLEA